MGRSVGPELRSSAVRVPLASCTSISGAVVGVAAAVVGGSVDDGAGATVVSGAAGGVTVGAGVAGGAAVTELERVEFRRLLMEFRGLVMIVGGATTATRTVVGVVAGGRGAVAGGEVTGGGGGAVTGGAVTGGGGGHSTKPVGEVGSSHRSAWAEMAGNVRNAAVAAAPSTPIRAHRPTCRRPTAPRVRHAARAEQSVSIL